MSKLPTPRVTKRYIGGNDSICFLPNYACSSVYPTRKASGIGRMGKGRQTITKRGIFMMAAYGMICACVLNGMEPQTVTPFTEQEEGRERDIPYCVSYAVGVGFIFCAHTFCDGLSFPLDFSSLAGKFSGFSP